MRDVADRAGVSVTSVSHVINQTRLVSDDLRERVLTAMNELGYQPNALARSLRRKETYITGVIRAVPTIHGAPCGPQSARRGPTDLDKSSAL